LSVELVFDINALDNGLNDPVGIFDLIKVIGEVSRLNML
jgi:hypothetical protein